MHEHHCTDERCDDCPHCADGSGGDGQCGSWCHGQHCGDTRCASCSFCTPKAPPPSPVAPPSESFKRPGASDGPIGGRIDSSTALTEAKPHPDSAEVQQQESAQVARDPILALNLAAPGGLDGLVSAAKVAPERQCPNWCNEKHCENRETRCAACVICDAQLISGASPEQQRPRICEPFCKPHHCKLDDRCSECDVCDGIAAVWPPPPPPLPPPQPPRCPPLRSPPPPWHIKSPPLPAQKFSSRAEGALPAKRGPPTALAVRQVNCSAASLSWMPPATDDTIVEYELMVRPTSSDASGASLAPFAVSGLHSTSFTVDSLESSTDFTVQARARTAAGWSALSGELVMRTSPPVRVLPASDPPVREQTLKQSDACNSVRLRLPALRRGCARETALSLEYREAGAADWRQYVSPATEQLDTDAGATQGQRQKSALLVTLPREHSYNSVYFRLRAHRGHVVSEPSELLGPIDTCEPEPVRSMQTVFVASSIAVMLLFLVALVVHCKSAATTDDFSSAKPPSREPGMTRLKTTDDEDPLGDLEDDYELSVFYHLGGTPLHGMLPLAGIRDSSELLKELAEFGCELQDDIILNVSMMDAEYEDVKGKTKALGPRTPLSEVVRAVKVTVLSKMVAQRKRGKPPRAINGANANTDDFEVDVDQVSIGQVRPKVEIKMSPRPVGARYGS